MQARGSLRRRLAFTLIEMMAVVLIIALAMAVVIPNLSATRGSRLEETALDLAARIELARELAVATGAPHRVLIDIESGDYSIDWWVSEQRALAANGVEDDELPEAAETIDTADPFAPEPEISLSPPADDSNGYYPIPGRFGSLYRLPEDYFFEGVTTPEGWIDEGAVQIVFEWDGTSDFAEIVLVDSWENSLVLEVQPLLETVRILEDEAAG